MNYKGYEDGIIRGSIGLGVDYYKGEKGDNGISPTISVVEIQNGHRVIINDVDGEKSFDILDGEDGEGGKGIITRSAEIAYNQVEGNIYRWQTITQPDFTGVNDFNYARVSLKATHNDLSHPYSTYLTLYPNKPGTAFCGYCDGGIYTLTMVGSNWQGGCVDIYKINNKANEIDSVKREIGGLSDLMTEDTSSIVNAINEVQGLAMSNQYTLPTASTSTLGGVKVDGNTITIDQDGVISASDSGSDVVYTAGNGISISGNEISVNTDDLVGQGENIASVSYVDNAIANIPSSGGSGYTFTNGLTESNGTVSWDLNDRIKAGGQRGAVAIGYDTTASGDCSYAEGYRTKATSGASHAEGELTQAIGSKSHAEGNRTTASGGASHAEGNSTNAEGRSAHAEGNSTVAQSNEQHAEGMFNIGDSNSIFQNIAGNGTAYNARSNSFARDWDGNEYLAGNLYVGCSDYSTTSEGLTTANAGGSKVATESYVDQAIADIPSSGSGTTYTAGDGIDIDSNGVISSYSLDNSVPLFLMLLGKTGGENGFSRFITTLYNGSTKEQFINGIKAGKIVELGFINYWGGLGTDLYNLGFQKVVTIAQDGTASTVELSSSNQANWKPTRYWDYWACGNCIIGINHPYNTVFGKDLIGNMYYNNATSGLSASTVKGAIDELANEKQDAIIPTAPTADGSYKLTSTTTSGTSTYSWVADSSTSYTAGNGISIDSNGVISLDLSSAEGVGF